MKVVIGCDHAGFEAKSDVIDVLESIACSYEDVGVFSKESCDYPLIARKVCNKILTDKSEFGILICGSGTGMVIAANRFNGIRAAMCYDEYSAKMSRIDNNCNVLCLRSREFDTSAYYEIIRAFFDNSASKEIRHQKRVELLDEITEYEEF